MKHHHNQWVFVMNKEPAATLSVIFFFLLIETFLMQELK